LSRRASASSAGCARPRSSPHRAGVRPQRTARPTAASGSTRRGARSRASPPGPGRGATRAGRAARPRRLAR